MNNNRYSPRNTALQAGLTGFKSNYKSAERIFTGVNLPRADDLGEDGEDHINVWDDAETQLGKLLAHSAAVSFVHPHFGKFASVKGLWFYLQSSTGNVAFKSLTGTKLDKLKKQEAENGRLSRSVIHFQALIIEATQLKVEQNQNIEELLRDSDLPFDCYFYYIDRETRMKGERTRLGFAPWLLRGMEEIRSAVKDGRDVDLLQFHDQDRLNINRYTGKPEVEKPKKEKEVAALTQSRPVPVNGVENATGMGLQEFNEEMNPVEGPEKEVNDFESAIADSSGQDFFEDAVDRPEPTMQFIITEVPPAPVLPGFNSASLSSDGEEEI